MLVARLKYSCIMQLKNVTTHSHTRSGSHSRGVEVTGILLVSVIVLRRYTIYYTESDSRCTLLIPFPLVLVVPSPGVRVSPVIPSGHRIAQSVKGRSARIHAPLILGHSWTVVATLTWHA